MYESNIKMRNYFSHIHRAEVAFVLVCAVGVIATIVYSKIKVFEA